jgi:hypothetical protein
MRRVVLGDLRPILEAQGIQFINIDGVMSDEEHRSSFASIAWGWMTMGGATSAFNRARNGR